MVEGAEDGMPLLAEQAQPGEYLPSKRKYRKERQSPAQAQKGQPVPS